MSLSGPWVPLCDITFQSFAAWTFHRNHGKVYRQPAGPFWKERHRYSSSHCVNIVVGAEEKKKKM